MSGRLYSLPVLPRQGWRHSAAVLEMPGKSRPPFWSPHAVLDPCISRRKIEIDWTLRGPPDFPRAKDPARLPVAPGRVLPGDFRFLPMLPETRASTPEEEREILAQSKSPGLQTLCPCAVPTSSNKAGARRAPSTRNGSSLCSCPQSPCPPGSRPW